jgi:hypothetical protein
MTSPYENAILIYRIAVYPQWRIVFYVKIFEMMIFHIPLRLAALSFVAYKMESNWKSAPFGKSNLPVLKNFIQNT